jgi:hypothetical protein
MDPYPFKHPAIILARLREGIEPSLRAAGFQFEGRNKPSTPIHLYLDYARPGELFRLSWDCRDSNRFLGFTAEFLRDSEEVILVAADDLSDLASVPKRQITPAIQVRIDSLVAAINAFLTKLVTNDAPRASIR